MPRARALAFLRALAAAGGEQRLEVPAGTLLRSPGEPQAYVGNQLLLDRPGDLDARGLIALADELMGGLGHRRVLLTDDAEGERLHRALLPHGWGGGAEIVMALPPDAELPAAARATAVDPERLQAVERITNAELGLSGDVGEQVLRVRARAAAAIGARGFVATAPDGADAAHATVYGEGPVAEIEDVATRVPYRGRGLARDVIAACVADARARGAELVFLTADGDDWPQHLYARMGFVPIARTWVVQREGLTAAAPGPAQSGSRRRPPA